VWSNYQATASGGDIVRTLYDNIQYDAAGQMIYADLGNSLSTVWTYNPHRRNLDRVDHLDASGAMFAYAEYLYDDNDNIGFEEHSLANDWVEKSHAYDALDRLEYTSLQTGNLWYQQNFLYSSTGNIEEVAADTSESYDYSDTSLPQAVTL
jgi:hypothetical protein